MTRNDTHCATSRNIDSNRSSAAAPATWIWGTADPLLIAITLPWCGRHGAGHLADTCSLVPQQQRIGQSPVVDVGMASYHPERTPPDGMRHLLYTVFPLGSLLASFAWPQTTIKELPPSFLAG